MENKTQKKKNQNGGKKTKEEGREICVKGDKENKILHLTF